MKRTRTGFTLVELLIVIGIISILGVMSFMAGGEATNAANATKIVDDLKMIGTAMTMYYADNKISCDKLGSTIKAAQIKAGLSPYLKSSDILADTPTAGMYNVAVPTQADGTWWVQYKLPKPKTKLAQILANKAMQEGLYAGPDSTGAYFTAGDAAVDIYYQAH